MNNLIKSGILYLLILLINVFSLNAKVIPHQAYGIPVSSDFQVWVNNNEVFTGQAGNNRWSYSFCVFDFDEPVNIRVKAKRAIKWLEILPSILKTEHRIIDDFTFEFKLEQPEDLTFFINNDKKCNTRWTDHWIFSNF